MRTQSIDTDPTIERIQIEGLRRMTPMQRLLLADSWTRDIQALSWAGLRRLHPEADELELRLLWVAHLYGAELAERVRAYLAARAK